MCIRDGDRPQPLAPGDRLDGVHVGGLTVQVHRHDADGARRDEGLNARGVDREGVGRGVAEHHLPAGLRDSDRLPEPIFTPSTKAPMGEHDENISFDQAAEIVGRDLAEQVKRMTLRIYSECAEYALKRGIIIADTKFEFGVDGGTLYLIDEVLTPDSSRFWAVDGYEAGKAQPSFDKQFVRDYLNSIGWNKQPPAPELPAEIAEKTAAKYREALDRLTK